MKTIKVFLASSDELRDERQKFGDLIRRLDDIYVKRGIHVQLLMWEDVFLCDTRYGVLYSVFSLFRILVSALFTDRSGFPMAAAISAWLRPSR